MFFGFRQQEPEATERGGSFGNIPDGSELKVAEMPELLERRRTGRLRSWRWQVRSTIYEGLSYRVAFRGLCVPVGARPWMGMAVSGCVRGREAHLRRARKHTLAEKN
jgi:hypothetical protein